MSIQRMLSQLLPETTLKTDVVVTGLAEDSRRVEAGDLFLASPGLRHDGRHYIDEVLGRAAAVVCQAPCVATNDAVIVVDDLISLKGLIACRFWGEPSARLLVVGITGTNGKTSSSHFVAQALTALNKKCGVIGTLGYGFPGDLQEAGLTTPSALDIQRQLATLSEQAAEAVAIETSSHGLVQGRLNGTQIHVAMFTNLSRDHLDYHGSFSEYRAAKQRLFEWPDLQAAIVNYDDEFGRAIPGLLHQKVQAISYSVKDESVDVFCRSLNYDLSGFEAELVTPWGSGLLRCNLLGEFHVSNVLGVVSLLGVLGYKFSEITRAASGLRNVLGRMDAIARPGMPLVVIDYAHTPDALAKALKALRVNCRGNLWCVFGCGGDRDKGKRPQMGQIATEIADYSIVTDDNPRSEASAAIIGDIVAGAIEGRNLTIESNRRRAIQLALSSAKTGDIVLIAGKGHEDYQEINGQRISYSDYSEVESFLSQETNRVQPLDRNHRAS
jgi:UDP-N-acetylmuramoyl-L-alanyl-D-glutamate--2,6-diaminopimelate ligase